MMRFNGILIEIFCLVKRIFSAFKPIIVSFSLHTAMFTVNVTGLLVFDLNGLGGLWGGHYSKTISRLQLYLYQTLHLMYLQWCGIVFILWDSVWPVIYSSYVYTR